VKCSSSRAAAVESVAQIGPWCPPCVIAEIAAPSTGNVRTTAAQSRASNADDPDILTTRSRPAGALAVFRGTGAKSTAIRPEHL
jgi:hypothetical protein